MDKIEQFSKPIKTEKTKLGTKIYLNTQKLNSKRDWTVLFDERHTSENFKVKYVYYARFKENNSVAGNHYHKIKKELFIPLEGEFEIYLEEISTKQKETITLNSKKNVAFIIGTKIAHKIISKNSKGILLVLANNPSKEKDEIHYIQ